ncbi:small glutamine-rich tetratricopeptide repeat-containing protein alpha-like [Anolis sagrei]|uniref:small glutamine-rich tetratricopeptide repeat-containing protein alpha-like n=1 Tax=Anolis sagrei TaxID=38937 RepID=UPI00352087FB
MDEPPMPKSEIPDDSVAHCEAFARFFADKVVLIQSDFDAMLTAVSEDTGSSRGFDLAGLLNNPSFINMAANLVNSPQLQQLMSGVISEGQATRASDFSSSSALGASDLASLIQAGQQFAQQMQQQNPELIKQLWSQIRSRTPSASNEEQQE